MILDWCFLTAFRGITKLVNYFSKVYVGDVCGENILYHARASNEKVVVVFNHVGYTDISLLQDAFGTFCFVSFPENLNIFPFSWFARKLGFIPTRKGGTVQVIKKYIETRKASEPLLIMAPDACGAIPPGECIAPFRTGAFALDYQVIPVVLRYFPRQPFQDIPCTVSAMIFERLHIRSRYLRVHIRVLPPMQRHPDETIHHFTQRVRQEMIDTYDSMSR